MQRARARENNRQPVPGRGADGSASRPTPLTLVAGAVAGDDLESVAATVAGALACPVAIAIPALGEPVIAPPGSLGADAVLAVAAHAATLGEGLEGVPAPAPVVEAVAVRIGDQIVGTVAAVQAGRAPFPAAGRDAEPAGPDAAERRAWLEAAAAAASVTALIRDAHTGGPQGSSEVLLAELAAGPPEDLPDLLVRARRLGLDLTAGAVAISARIPGQRNGDALPSAAGMAARRALGELGSSTAALIAELRGGRVLALTPDSGGVPEALAARLRAEGLVVAVSAPRRDPAQLHEAVREAELLAELGGSAEPQPAGQDETYRLLIGVLLRERAELEQLRDSTISPLADYDARHDTDLVATLQAFLAHDGSTTETAEAMKLHRHTVGYRLSRVHEVAGLSPYESDGRERLSLGIKADLILGAERRLRDAQLHP